MRLLARSSRALLVFALAACGSATAPRSLTVETHPVTFATEAERLAWPFTPTVTGGAEVRVRGTVLLGCGDLAVSAVERGGQISVSVGAANTDRECVALVATWASYDVTLSGVDPGPHRVRVTVSGLDGFADWLVTVSPVMPLD